MRPSVTLTAEYDAAVKNSHGLRPVVPDRPTERPGVVDRVRRGAVNRTVWCRTVELVPRVHFPLYPGERQHGSRIDVVKATVASVLHLNVEAVLGRRLRGVTGDGKQDSLAIPGI